MTDVESRAPRERADTKCSDVRQLICDWNRQYNGGADTDEPRIRDDIEFWRVGHNASHEFYAGVRADGRVFTYSVGEEYADEPSEEFDSPVYDQEEIIEWSGVISSPIREIEDFRGYFGHF